MTLSYQKWPCLLQFGIICLTSRLITKTVCIQNNGQQEINWNKLYLWEKSIELWSIEVRLYRWGLCWCHGVRSRVIRWGPLLIDVLLLQPLENLLVAEQWQGHLPATLCSCPLIDWTPYSCPSSSEIGKNCPSPLPQQGLWSLALVMPASWDSHGVDVLMKPWQPIWGRWWLSLLPPGT